MIKNLLELNRLLHKVEKFLVGGKISQSRWNVFCWGFLVLGWNGFSVRQKSFLRNLFFSEMEQFSLPLKVSLLTKGFSYKFARFVNICMYIFWILSDFLKLNSWPQVEVARMCSLRRKSFLQGWAGHIFFYMGRFPLWFKFSLKWWGFLFF